MILFAFYFSEDVIIAYFWQRMFSSSQTFLVYILLFAFISNVEANDLLFPLFTKNKVLFDTFFIYLTLKNY
jgi:hypothetical protein